MTAAWHLRAIHPPLFGCNRAPSSVRAAPASKRSRSAFVIAPRRNGYMVACGRRLCRVPVPRARCASGASRSRGSGNAPAPGNQPAFVGDFDGQTDLMTIERQFE